MVSAITLQQFSLSFGKQEILSDINFSLEQGKWLGLLGASGIGKTSLLRAIADLKHREESVTGLIQTLPFSYMAQTDLLLPWLTVLENAVIGYRLRGQAKPTTRCHPARFLARNLVSRCHPAQLLARDPVPLLDKAKSLLAQAGLAHAYDLFPKQLSGGMRQRVALVRTLLEERPVVLMDEPFSALDAITRYKLQNLARTWLQSKTVLFVTHDPVEALRLSDEIYLLHGRPAQLKKVATLSSSAPREPSSPEIVNLETELLHELAAVSEDP